MGRTVRLEPCAVCGGQPEFERGRGFLQLYHRFVCTCGNQGPLIEVCSRWWKLNPADDVFNAWNRSQRAKRMWQKRREANREAE